MFVQQLSTCTTTHSEERTSMKLEIVERTVKQIWQDVCSEALTTPSDALAYLNSLDDFRDSDREVFVVLHLDARNRVVAHHIIVAPPNGNISMKELGIV